MFAGYSLGASRLSVTGCRSVFESGIGSLPLTRPAQDFVFPA